MKHTLLPVLLLGFAGCQHVPPTFVVREVPVQITSSNSLDVIRFPSSYKGYTVGRRPDVSNPALMHEAHILYVRETSDRWNLQPPAAPMITPALSAVAPDPTFAPLPVSEQLRQELQKQQQQTQSLAEQTKRFQQSADALVPAAMKAVELSTLMQQRVQSLEARLRQLEGGPRLTSPTNWTSLGSTNR